MCDVYDCAGNDGQGKCVASDPLGFVCYKANFGNGAEYIVGVDRATHTIGHTDENCAQCGEPLVNLFSGGLLFLANEGIHYTCCSKCKDEFDTALEQFVRGWTKYKKLTPDKSQPEG